MGKDEKTAQAFATSWNNLPEGSVYTREQFEDWMRPLTQEDVRGKTVLELGCGNASLLCHMAEWDPKRLDGVDLGDSVLSAKRNMERSPFKNWNIIKDDLTNYRGGGADIVYCIGVLHHLKVPKDGLDSVVRNTRKGGRFHCWVYAEEGNGIIIHVVDPIRKLVSRFPWWITKYCIATTLVIPYFCYAKTLSLFRNIALLRKLPLFEYSLWISKRDFSFFRHVAFDQLVTPQTAYINRKTIEEWLSSYGDIDHESEYVIFRNGNSWKFGARKK